MKIALRLEIRRLRAGRRGCGGSRRVAWSCGDGADDDGFEGMVVRVCLLVMVHMMVMRRSMTTMRMLRHRRRRASREIVRGRRRGHSHQLDRLQTRSSFGELGHRILWHRSRSVSGRRKRRRRHCRRSDAWPFRLVHACAGQAPLLLGWRAVRTRARRMLSGNISECRKNHDLELPDADVAHDKGRGGLGGSRCQLTMTSRGRTKLLFKDSDVQMTLRPTATIQQQGRNFRKGRRPSRLTIMAQL